MVRAVSPHEWLASRRIGRPLRGAEACMRRRVRTGAQRRARAKRYRVPVPTDFAMKYYYTNSQNSPVGPVDWAELQRLLDAGTINPTTHVIAEGSQQWVPLSSLREIASAPATAAGTSALGVASAPRTSGGTPEFAKAATFFPQLVDKLINFVRGLMTAAQLENLLDALALAGQWLVL